VRRIRAEHAEGKSLGQIARDAEIEAASAEFREQRKAIAIEEIERQFSPRSRMRPSERWTKSS
jgi:hypothetical protein